MRGLPFVVFGSICSICGICSICSICNICRITLIYFLLSYFCGSKLISLSRAVCIGVFFFSKVRCIYWPGASFDNSGSELDPASQWPFKKIAQRLLPALRTQLDYGPPHPPPHNLIRIWQKKIRPCDIFLWHVICDVMCDVTHDMPCDMYFSPMLMLGLWHFQNGVTQGVQVYF